MSLLRDLLRLEGLLLLLVLMVAAVGAQEPRRHESHVWIALQRGGM
jgi:hypothetical protein